MTKLIFGGDVKDGTLATGWKDVPYEPAALEVGMTEADLSNKNLGTGGAIIVAAWISHRDKGALTSLDLSSNKLQARGAKIVAEAIKVTNCAIAIILVPFLCLSDLSFNCCCLPISTGQWGVVAFRYQQ